MMVTYLQKYAYKAMKMGYNVFLTGNAGTGKSFIVNKFISDSEDSGRTVIKLAPTGIAASAINGVTIHKQFKLPLGVISNRIAVYDDTDEALVEADIVVVDEISMCRIDLFDVLATKIFRANSLRKRRGKTNIQLIVLGDFFQLPPVITASEKSALDKLYNTDIGAGFAFQSKYWNLFEFKNIYLVEVMRQQDPIFLSNLDKVRLGDKSSIDYFFKSCAKTKLDDAITICGTNSEVKEINRDELNKIPGDVVEYRAILEGNASYNDVLADFILELKPGVPVMSLINGDGFNNGNIGKIVKLESDIIGVEFNNGVYVDIERYTWDIYRYTIDETSNTPKVIKEVVGQFIQFPIKLSYAITIHKSQGQTYDTVNLSPYSWDHGQLYTALSRVKSIDKMYLKYDIQTYYNVVASDVIKFHNEMVKTANKEVTPKKEEVKQLSAEEQSLQNDMNTIMKLLSKGGK